MLNIVLDLHESESHTELTEVKSELSSLKIASRMHHNTLFQDRNLKKKFEEGHSQTPPPPLGAYVRLYLSEVKSELSKAFK